MENERQNLVRVNDILAELEKQTEPLEKQSEKAKIYLKKKEEMKTLDVNMFLLENNRMQQQLTDVTGRYEIAQADLNKAKDSFAGIKEEYERVVSEIERLEEEIGRERENLSNASELRGKLEVQINILKEQIRSAGDNREHFALREQSVRSQIAEKEEEKNAILEEKKAFDAAYEKMRLQMEEAAGRLSDMQQQMDAYNETIEKDKKTIIDALTERATIKSKIGRYDTMLEQINIRKAEMSSRLLLAQSEEEKQDEEIERLEQEFEQINVTIRELNEQQTKLEERNSEITDELSAKDQKLRDTQVLYHQEKSKLEAISNLTERYDGYGNSIRRVMEQKEQNVGVVADIVKVEKKYEVAIETALGGNIQNIVTEDEETAKKMIRFLKKNKYGRATFLPLTSILHPQEFKTPEVLKEKGVLGMADALVETEKKYRNVAKAMLGRIVVVDDVDHAVQIARKYDYGIRMVTLEGELLVPGGAISGGAFKNASNLLGRRREMSFLQRSNLICIRLMNCWMRSKAARRSVQRCVRIWKLSREICRRNSLHRIQPD